MEPDKWPYPISRSNAELQIIIRNYNEQNIPVIVITNQAGIAKGIYTETQMHIFNNYMNERLGKEYGAHIDAIYFCPHHPNYTGNCDCRKPKPGLFFQAAAEWNINLHDSIMYGDKESDRKAAEAAGIRYFKFIQPKSARTLGNAHVEK